MTLALYDLQDNIVAIFTTYSECAKIFDCTENRIQSYLSKVKKDPTIKIGCDGKWYRIFKVV